MKEESTNKIITVITECLLFVYGICCFFPMSYEISIDEETYEVSDYIYSCGAYFFINHQIIESFMLGIATLLLFATIVLVLLNKSNWVLITGLANVVFVHLSILIDQNDFILHTVAYSVCWVLQIALIVMFILKKNADDNLSYAYEKLEREKEFKQQKELERKKIDQEKQLEEEKQKQQEKYEKHNIYGNTAEVEGQTGCIHFPQGPNQGLNIPIANGETYVIGSDASSSNIVVSQLTVSRQHLRITFVNGLYRVEDLSSNGTFLENGTRLMNGSAVMINPGTMLVLSNDAERIILM